MAESQNETVFDGRVDALDLARLREYQLYQLDILKEFARVCDEHGLRWWLGYGTLLGAVRHQGFIPWDDDIDLIMPSDDYLRFRSIARTSLAEGFYLQTHEDNPCNFVEWQRIGVTSSTSMPYEYAGIHAEWGICIDIFPVYPFPTEDDPRRGKAMRTLEWLKRHTAKYLYRHEAVSQGSFARRMYYRAMGSVPDFLNVALWKRCERKILVPFDDPSYDRVAFEFKEKMCDRKEFAQTIMLPFEGLQMPAPAGYENVLNAWYGPDWRELPPVEKRVWHSGGGSDEVLVSLTEPYEKFLK